MATALKVYLVGTRYSDMMPKYWRIRSSLLSWPSCTNVRGAYTPLRLTNDNYEIEGRGCRSPKWCKRSLISPGQVRVHEKRILHFQ